jgi:hypothetical protein
VNIRREKGSLCAPVRSVSLGKTWPSEIVFAHLMSGAEIIKGYILWIFHGEPLIPPVDNEAISEAPKTVRVDSILLHSGSSGMQDMLNDVFYDARYLCRSGWV